MLDWITRELSFSRIMDLRYLSRRKSELTFPSDKTWDIYVSAYNNSDRVKVVFDKFPARRKIWAILPEYEYDCNTLANYADAVRFSPGANETDVVTQIIESAMLSPADSLSLCVDITGFMRPHILYLIKHLSDSGLSAFDLIYTEPERYSRKENTTFSNEEIEFVRQVNGYEGDHGDETTQEVLIVGVGYDDALISRVINDKDSAKLYQLMSLPSLSADMYQESILRLDKVLPGADGDMYERTFFAPANDPFVVADELSRKCAEISSQFRQKNLYLCPLATKPQAVGFALFYLSELVGTASSIIFPFARLYDRETGFGVGRTWQYELKFEK